MGEASKRPARGSAWGKRLAVCLAPTPFILASCVWLVLSDEHFRPVVAGKVYRSAQLSATRLRHYVHQYQLRSIVNLRGSNQSQAWYRDECEAARRLGVHHYDLSTDTEYPPNAEELQELVRILRECRKPVLIHCCSGVDRTGTVSAIARVLLEGATPQAAKEELGQGYCAWWHRDSAANARAFLDCYESWLQHHQLQASSARFVQWARTSYDPPVELRPIWATVARWRAAREEWAANTRWYPSSPLLCGCTWSWAWQPYAIRNLIAMREVSPSSW